MTGFDGLLEKADKDAAAAEGREIPPAPPAAIQHMSSPATRQPPPELIEDGQTSAEDDGAEGDAPPADGGTPPAPEGEQPETPPAPAATPPTGKKWKVPLKVAGEDLEEEFEEDDFDPAKKPERFKRIQELLQKAYDYDRPDGALTKLARRQAQEAHARRMVELGLWVYDEGKKQLVDSPSLIEFREFVAKKGQGGQPAGAAPPPPPQELTPRQKRIADLQAKYDDPEQSITGAEVREFQQLVTDEQIDARAAADRQEAEAQRTRAQAEATRRKQSEDADKAAYKAIDDTVKAVEEQYRDPTTKQIDVAATQEAKDLMEATLRKAQKEGQDPATCWTLAAQKVKQHADRFARSVRPSTASQPPKPSTGPKAPPVPRGQGGAPGAAPQKGKTRYDPSKPFSEQSHLADIEKENAATPA